MMAWRFDKSPRHSQTSREFAPEGFRGVEKGLMEKGN